MGCPGGDYQEMRMWELRDLEETENSFSEGWRLNIFGVLFLSYN